MKKIRIKSAIPIYLAAAVWLLVGIIRPTMLLKMGTLLLTAVLSAAVYAVGLRIFRGKTVEVREKADTGDAQVDRQIEAAEALLERLAGYQKEIQNGEVLKSVSSMHKVGEAILDAVKTDPARFHTVRRFVNYYLPTVDKIMADYVALVKSPAKGEHIRAAIASVEENLAMIEKAFERQLDSLYRDKSFDMDAELTALETILKGEGLAGGRDFAETEDEDTHKIQLGM